MAGEFPEQEAHLVPHGEGVVAGEGIGAERKRDARFFEQRHGRLPHHEPVVAPGAEDYADAAPLEDMGVVRGYLHRMDRRCGMVQDPEPVQVGDGGGMSRRGEIVFPAGKRIEKLGDSAAGVVQELRLLRGFGQVDNGRHAVCPGQGDDLLHEPGGEGVGRMGGASRASPSSFSSRLQRAGSWPSASR